MKMRTKATLVVCSRFGYVSVEGLESTLLSKEESMTTATRSKVMTKCLLIPRSKGSLILLSVGEVLVSSVDFDERKCEGGIASAFTLAPESTSKEVVALRERRSGEVTKTWMVVASLWQDQIWERTPYPDGHRTHHR
jgi:hypothetical protein